MDLDLTFCDRTFTQKTLEALSPVVRAIRERAQADELTLWTFLTHLARHDRAMRVSPPPGLAADIDKLLTQLSLPVVKLESLTDPAPLAVVKRPTRLRRAALALATALLALVVGYFAFGRGRPALAAGIGGAGGILLLIAYRRYFK